MRSADWDLNDTGGVQIRSADQGLADNSCRPWIRLERPRLAVAPGELKRYRFEIQVPNDAADGECRVAVLVSPAPETVQATNIDGLSVPIAGRVAVIIYVTIGGAKAILEYRGAEIVEQGPRRLPALRFFNAGNAHGRPFGSVSAVDAGGKRFELVAVPFPILAGREFPILLQPFYGDDPNPPTFEPQWPMELSGRIEWHNSQIRITDTVKD